MALDQADITKIGELIGAALSSEAHTKAIGEAATAAVKKVVGELKLDKVGETIDEKVSAATKDLKAPPDDKKGVDKKDPDDPTAKRLKALEDQVAQERKGREEAEAARKRDSLHTAAREALVKAGVPADRVRHAMATIIQDGVLAETSDGKPGWRGKDRFGVETVLPVEDGARAWVATDDGKAFIPARGANGTGDGAGGGPGGHGGPTTVPKKADGTPDFSALRGAALSGLSGGSVSAL